MKGSRINLPTMSIALYGLILLFAVVVNADSASSGSRLTVTPVQKVVQLLQGMAADGKKAKHEEEVEFATFKEWCEGTQKSTEKNIKTAELQIEQLDADVSKADADVERLAVEVSDLDTSVAQAEADRQKAIDMRKNERNEYMTTHADFSESIDALERALVALRSKKADVPHSLVQLKASPHVPDTVKASIESFLALSSFDEPLGSPKANAYEFQSGGVVDLLEKLRLKFQDQRTVLQKEEMNSKANSEMLVQKLSNQINDEERRSTEKQAMKSSRAEAAATAKGDRQNTVTQKTEDENNLQDTLTACHAKSEEFEKNQVVRAEEVKAIETAVGILKSDDVSGNAAKHLPALIDVGAAKKARSLVQLRGGGDVHEVTLRQRLTRFLHDQSVKTGSKYLNLVALHAEADPFEKVKQMIQGLITKLLEQANSEADHKAYCNAELSTNKLTRENKQTEVEKLAADVDKCVAETAELAAELSGLAEAMSELRREQAGAAEMRNKEKSMNMQTIDDAKAAQVAVERAMQVLRDFYGNVADASLLQGRTVAPYTGMQSEHGGIVGFMEVILTDFARLEAETSTAEDQASSAHQKFMDESAQDLAVKETAVGHKTNKKQDTEAETLSLRRELGLTQEELDAALAYYDKLKPDCVDQGLSYERRVEMRKEEIQSLKEALQILDQQDMA